MAYQDNLDSFSRTPVTLAIITLDFCGRVFGIAPCTATGEPCYNTYPTCKDKSNYLKQTKDYEFTSVDTSLPFKAGERPYLEPVQYMPTEIKDNLTVHTRVTLKLRDEPDTDVDIDPYVSQRAAVQGTFWGKLTARNSNFIGREIRVLDGFLDDPKNEFQERFVGQLDNMRKGRGAYEVEAVDLLKSLSNIQVPPKLDIKLVADIDAVVTTITVSSVTDLDSPSGYIRIGDEMIYYTGVSGGSNQLTGCTRGYFETTAATHSAKDKIQKVRYYAPANPFGILKEMLLTDASMDATRVNSTNIDYWRDWPGGEINFSAIISEPTKLSELYFEIVELLDCKSWVGEDQKITVRRNIPNEPGRTYHDLTDTANIIENSASTDLNQESRISRFDIYWDKTATGKFDEPGSYNRLDKGIDPDAESANFYGQEAPKELFCRWIRTGYEQDEVLEQLVADFLARRVWRQRDPMPIIEFGIELKDSDILTGDYVKISTDEILNIDGSPLERETFQIIKRSNRGGKITLLALRIAPRKFDFIAPDATPNFLAASEADKEYGFICDDDGLNPDGSPGSHIY